MTTHLNFGLLVELWNGDRVATVRVCFDSVEWGNGADLCPEVLYEKSRPAEQAMIAAEEPEIYGRKRND